MISRRVESFLCLHNKNTSHMEVISINVKLPCKLFWATVIKNTLHIHLYKLKSWKNMSIHQKSKCFQCGCLRGTVIIKQPESKRNADISEPAWLPTAVQTVLWRKQIDLGHVLRVPDPSTSLVSTWRGKKRRWPWGTQGNTIMTKAATLQVINLNIFKGLVWDRTGWWWQTSALCTW